MQRLEVVAHGKVTSTPGEARRQGPVDRPIARTGAVYTARKWNKVRKTRHWDASIKLTEARALAMLSDWASLPPSDPAPSGVGTPSFIQYQRKCSAMI